MSQWASGMAMIIRNVKRARARGHNVIWSLDEVVLNCFNIPNLAVANGVLQDLNYASCTTMIDSKNSELG